MADHIWLSHVPVIQVERPPSPLSSTPQAELPPVPPRLDLIIHRPQNPPGASSPGVTSKVSRRALLTLTHSLVLVPTVMPILAFLLLNVIWFSQLFFLSRQHLITKTNPSPFPRCCAISPLPLLPTAPTPPGRPLTVGCRDDRCPALQESRPETSSRLHPHIGPSPTGTPGPFPKPPPRRRPPPPPLHPLTSQVWRRTSERVPGSSPTDTPSRWRCPPPWTHARTHRRTTAPSVWTTSWSEKPQSTTHCTDIWFEYCQPRVERTRKRSSVSQSSPCGFICENVAECLALLPEGPPGLRLEIVKYLGEKTICCLDQRMLRWKPRGHGEIQCT